MDEVRLRKLDFPQSAKECLAQLDKFLSRNPTIPTGRMSKDLQSALDEHLYCISDRRGSFCLRLSCLQDLQLLLLLLNHYGTKSEADTRSRQILFEILFCPRDADGPFFDHRVKLLFRLVSLALQLHCAPLLADFALWIQKSKNLIHLVPLSAVLIEDFCATGQTFTVDRNHLYSAFYEVITICPTFAFVSFAAVCKGSQRRQFPTQPLMEILTEWLSSPKPLIKAFKDASKVSLFHV